MFDLRRALIAATLAVTSCAAVGPPPDEPIVVAPPQTIAASGPSALADDEPAPLTARAALDQLTVKGRGPKTGYSRGQFPHWSDWDGDGCDTRADVLRRDAIPGTGVTDRGMCTVGATVRDPYTGADIVEVPGPDSELDIEHIVALGDAWVTGAAQWSPEQRERFANDTTNLMAVDDEQNQKHSDGDAATWLPPRREYRCAYVANQIAVKLDYGLWVKPAERDAMARVLDGCPAQLLPTRASGPLR